MPSVERRADIDRPAPEGTSETALGSRERLHGSEHDAHLVRAAVVREGDRFRVDPHSVELRARNIFAASLWVLDDDRVVSGTESPVDREARPQGRNARIDAEGCAVSAQ